jgi:hypothetical protein
VSQWEEDNLLVNVDGTDGTQDVDAGMPDGLDRLDVGVDYAGASQANGIIGDLEFFERVQREL